MWPAFGFAGAPLSPATVERRSSLFPGAIARLSRGLTIGEAQRRVDVLVQSLRRQFPADYPPRSDWRVRLVPLKDIVVGDVRQPLLFLFGAVALVLLIGCANVANLLLARASARGREMAVRQALGGAPSRLTRQLLTESIVLSVVGGIAGFIVLAAARSSLMRLVPESVPRLNDISIDWGVLLFAFAASLAVGAIFGLAPALQVRRVDVTGVLKQEGRGSTSSRGQKRARAVARRREFALSLVLMSAAGLLLRSFWGLLNAPLGFDPHNVTVLRTRLPYPNEKAEDLYPTAAAEAPFVREVIRRCKALPGVEDVALGSGAAVPLDHPEQDQTQLRVVLERNSAPSDAQPLFITGSEVTPTYFHLLGMSLLRGRLLDGFDTDSGPSVAVVNEAMARTYWPNENVLGKRIKLSPRASAWTTVVGVVADARTESLATASAPHIYTSLYQQQGKHLAIFLRGHFETGAIARAVRDEVQSVNSALPVFGVETLGETVSASLAVRRFSMELIALFARDGPVPCRAWHLRRDLVRGERAYARDQCSAGVGCGQSGSDGHGHSRGSKAGDHRRMRRTRGRARCVPRDRRLARRRQSQRSVDLRRGNARANHSRVRRMLFPRTPCDPHRSNFGASLMAVGYGVSTLKTG